MTRHALRFDAPYAVLATALGMGPSRSGLDLTADELRVRMGWAFRARIPIHEIRAAAPGRRPPLGGWGVHGWAGRWLVNGSGSGIVRFDLGPAGRARVLGVGVRLAVLSVSLAEPERFLADLDRIRATTG